jgi:hypothetical protein
MMGTIAIPASAVGPAREAAILMRDRAADELMAEDQPTDGIEAIGECEVGLGRDDRRGACELARAALREYRFRAPPRR